MERSGDQSSCRVGTCPASQRASHSSMKLMVLMVLTDCGLLDLVVKGARLSGPQLQISPVERDLERGNPLLSSISPESDQATDGVDLASHLEPRLVQLLTSLGKSQEDTDAEACRADNP